MCGKDMMSKRNSAKKLAFSAIIAALSTVLMFLSGVIPVATIALPAIAGCMLIPVVIETNIKWGFAVYMVCSLLSLLLSSDKEAVFFYILFFGYYPLLYAVLGKIKWSVLRYAVKLLIYNMAVVAETLLSVYVLGIPFEMISGLGRVTIPLLLVLANLVFILYDYALDGLITAYIRRFHSKIHHLFRF